MNKKLTQSEANLIRDYLANNFPWLTNDDDSPSGADVIDTLCEIYGSLATVKRRAPSNSRIIKGLDEVRKALIDATERDELSAKEYRELSGYLQAAIRHLE